MYTARRSGGIVHLPHLKRVYAFGGHFDSAIAKSEFYDFEEDSWTEIAPLPVVSYNNTAIFHKGKIVLTGYGLFHIYIFGIET